MTDKPPLSLAVLISGGGTTLRNLINKIASGDLSAEIRLVVSSNRRARGLEYAEQAAIPTRIVERQASSNDADFSAAIFGPCRDVGVDLVAMGGFLKHVLIPDDFANRVLNIHPALIPAFCGPGFYGQRVHEAVLDYGAKISGCTVHFVDNQYDHGPIVLQRTVAVLDDDTPDSLAERIFAEECLAFPEAIQLCAEGRVHVKGRRIHLS
jgi:phosphoribosylglycinamide formyltransferase-1